MPCSAAAQSRIEWKHAMTRRADTRINGLEDLVTFSPRQVADAIGASEWWVRDQAAKRRVPHLRLGRAKIVFRRSDIVALQEILAVQVVIPDVGSDDHAPAPAPRSIGEAAVQAGFSRRTANRLARTSDRST